MSLLVSPMRRHRPARAVRSFYTRWLLLFVGALLLVPQLLVTPAHAVMSVGQKDRHAAHGHVRLTATQARSLMLKPVLQWSVHDAELWMNTTLGYPEYAAQIRRHVIDGPTILEMSGSDFENYFPVANPLHAIKFEAHVKLLRGDYACAMERGDGGGLRSGGGRHDFWHYLKQHPYRVWIEGSMALYSPRFAMVLTYLFDKTLYRGLTTAPSSSSSSSSSTTSGVFGESNATTSWSSSNSHDKHTREVPHRRTSVTRTLLYWISWLAAPQMYVAWNALSLWPRNYVVMGMVMLHMLQEAYSEYMLWILIYRREMFEPGTSLRSKVWRMYSHTILVPGIAVVISGVMPYMVQCVLVAVVLLLNMLVFMGWLNLIYEEMQGWTWLWPFSRGARGKSSTPKSKPAETPNTTAGCTTGDETVD